MNREILFRGKRIDIGKWEYGNLSIRDEYGKCQYYIGQNIFGYEVMPETVGQFTGLIDRNGRKIFEGDIVIHNEMHYEVKYSIKQARFLAVLPNGVFDPVAFQNCNVIGNIHDNPELLGGEEDD